jgi:hypothetical protein
VLHPALRVVAFLIGSWITLGTLVSAIKTVVVPRATSQFLTRAVFIPIRRFVDLFARESRDFASRDRAMSMYAPVALVVLPGLWMALCIGGGTLVHLAIAGSNVRAAFLRSGSSMLTLGTSHRNDLPSAAFGYFQATIGLGLVALLISYLPTIYGNFARREVLVGQLESRAGLPPSPFEMLVRYQRIGAMDQIDDDLFNRWETWFAEIEESHTSFPALVYFRSPHPERSWITAAGCVLDTAALTLSVVDRPFSSRAALCMRAGFLSLRRIAAYFSIPFDAQPAPTDPISVTRREFDNMCFELEAVGIRLKPNRQQAWLDFAGWRVNYDTVLVSLAKLTIAPPGVWSSDREGSRPRPRMIRWRHGRGGRGGRGKTK